MISSKYKCLFVHIPKTAGQSIEHYFLKLHGLSWEERAPLLLRYNPDPAKGPERLAHLTAREYVDYGYISSSQFADYFSFSFVRNPWARLVSEYRYRGHEGKYSFKEFVSAGFSKKSNYSDEYRHLMPQYEFLYDKNGKLLIDFVGKFESIQSDFDAVCLKMGIERAILPHINSSARGIIGNNDKLGADKLYTSYFDKELEEFVADIYAKDIRTFNYVFGS